MVVHSEKSGSVSFSAVAYKHDAVSFAARERRDTLCVVGALADKTFGISGPPMMTKSGVSGVTEFRALNLN